jgi:hypothetical protein
MTATRIKAGNRTYKKLAIQWLNPVLPYLSSFLLTNSFHSLNRQVLVTANRSQQANTENSPLIKY